MARIMILPRQTQSRNTTQSSLNFGAGPIVALGIIDKAGELGRIGGGIYDPPLSIFASALDALNQSLNPDQSCEH